MLSHYTRRFGYDTLRLNLDLGSDHTVLPLPTEDLWYGDKPLPCPRPSDPLQTSMQLKCLEVEAYGGGKLNLKNGERGLWRREDGVYYEWRRGPFVNLLSIEFSAPKLLFGHNKYPVSCDLLSDAFDEGTERARSFLGADLPPLHEFDLWRIDATSDVQLRSELEVGLVGMALYQRPLNGSLSTLHPTGGSVEWAAVSDFPRAICYGKSEESGDVKIAGRYRSELHVRGGKQFRKALAAAVAAGDLSSDLVAGRGARCLKGSALVEQGQGLCTELLGALIGVCDSAIDFVREVNTLTALESIGLLEAKAGVSRSRSVQLLGYAHIVRVLGWGFTGLSRTNIWRAKKEFEAAGIDPAAIEFSSAERLRAGAGMVAGGAIMGAAAAGGVLLGTAIGDALSPDAPSPKRSSKPALPESE